ncbi:MAG: kinase [Bdellovibrionaceae bacterium]|nr:kinase [Pseudobdellovibrionaceae bacterium]
MKVSVIINARAGRLHGNRERIEHNVRHSLFRCELNFLHPETPEDLQKCLIDEVRAGTDFLMVCGGDGTLNVAVQPLMKLRAEGLALPPLCPIPVGTANDLAREMHVSSRIDEAARNIIEGQVKTIDVIEISSPSKTAYMLTNGGFGIPAVTAERANRFRQWVHSTADCPGTKPHWRPFFRLGSKVIQTAGDRIYEAILATVITSWDRSSWQVELELPDQYKIVTRAPFIMINNQRVLGGRYYSAPLTNNSDGEFNVLLVEGEHLLSQAKSLLQIRAGQIPNADTCPSFETTSLIVRAMERPLTFFGDGEILHQNERELSIRCLHPGLPLVIRESA